MGCAPKYAPGGVPDWVFCPRERILKIVIGWIIDGFKAAGESVVTAIYAVFGAFGAAGDSAARAIVGAGAAVGWGLYSVAFTVNNAILSVATVAGPFSPFLVIVLYAGVGAAILGLLVGVKKAVLKI